MRNLQVALEELRTYLPHSDKVKADISSVSVGWHITHNLMVLIKISELVTKSDPKNYKWNFNVIRAILFPLNFFPRGRGKAPKPVQPQLNHLQDTEELFTAAAEAIKLLEAAHPKQYFVHHSFGMLDKKNTFIMIDIHNRHHLRIIKDIISANN